ncbi:mast cell protease 1A-like [Zootoca vivipara]|uniref:mast cell protease 1A-like n=1 Tax=Zootoca vivipara TaxID=8524 RepID=UPI001592299D|nr:mast cell protease 1A-like [Zootoca vivipara]
MWRLRQALLLLLLSVSLAQTDPLRSQIVGGHKAKPHSRPYMAHLMDPKGWFCGGFLVAPQWVMTAAHCNRNYRVTLGAHNISDDEEPSQQVFSIEANYAHPEYIKYYQNNELIIYNDIRLLKLNSNATLNEYVDILNLPNSKGDLSNGTPCSVAGWGRVYTDWSPDTLYETNVTISGCSRHGIPYPNIDGGKVCAGRLNKPGTVFKGDSGGPLVCNRVAQGIVSYGSSCPPSVYTRVYHYHFWIKKIMKL